MCQLGLSNADVRHVRPLSRKPQTLKYHHGQTTVSSLLEKKQKHWFHGRGVWGLAPK